MNKNYYQAIATMVGTIIGVGLFSIPFAISKAGLVPLLFLLPVLALVQHQFHRYYAEVIMANGMVKHRLPGYVEKYFGVKSKGVTLFVTLLASYGSLLAYTIVGGIFFQGLLAPTFGGSLFFYTTVLFAIEALIVLFGLKLIAKVEFYLTILLLLTIGLIVAVCFGKFEATNFIGLDWKYFFLPYGPVFFAVGGDAAIPEVCRLLAGDKKRIKRAIAWGTFIPAVATLLFAIAVVGVTGGKTSPDTLIGLSYVLSDGVIRIALLLGLLAVVTSFITVAQATKEIFFWDARIDKRISWVLALTPPYIFYLFGIHNLTKVVSLTGSVTGGLLGIVLIWLFFKVKNHTEEGAQINTRLSKGLAVVMSCFFIAGFLYSLFELL